MDHRTKSSISVAGRSGSGQKGVHSWYDVRIVYCIRPLRINIQCLPLIRPKNMGYIIVTRGPLPSAGRNFVISFSFPNKNIKALYFYIKLLSLHF